MRVFPLRRAKLYRWADETKEWKERGLGDVKILRNRHTGKYRVMLRREVVHKIACNFLLLPDMELCPMTTSNNAWTFAANDYDEEEGYSFQKFSIKFKVRLISNHAILADSCHNNRRQIDYRCEDGRFSLSASCVTFFNP
jgi:hypothetical protein